MCGGSKNGTPYSGCGGSPMNGNNWASRRPSCCSTGGQQQRGQCQPSCCNGRSNQQQRDQCPPPKKNYGLNEQCGKCCSCYCGWGSSYSSCGCELCPFSQGQRMGAGTNLARADFWTDCNKKFGHVNACGGARCES